MRVCESKAAKARRAARAAEVDHINNEKRLMAQISYPFIVNMPASQFSGSFSGPWASNFDCDIFLAETAERLTEDGILQRRAFCLHCNSTTWGPLGGRRYMLAVRSWSPSMAASFSRTCVAHASSQMSSPSSTHSRLRAFRVGFGCQC